MGGIGVAGTGLGGTGVDGSGVGGIGVGGTGVGGTGVYVGTEPEENVGVTVGKAVEAGLTVGDGGAGVAEEIFNGVGVAVFGSSRIGVRLGVPTTNFVSVDVVLSSEQVMAVKSMISPMIIRPGPTRPVY